MEAKVSAGLKGNFQTQKFSSRICALRSLMHEMLIYIYLNSVTVISLFLMIRMQQKTANHKYFSRKTH